MALTEKKLQDLFAAYNNVNQQTVEELITYLFSGAQTATSITQSSTAGLKIGLAGSKLGFFGADPIVKPTVSNSVIDIASDLPTAIAAVNNCRTVINSLRSKIASSAGGLGLMVEG